MFRTSIFIALALFSALASPTAQAVDVLVGNLGEPFRANTPIGNPSFLYWGAQSFFTGGGNYELSSIEAIVGDGCKSPTIVAELRKSDIDGNIDTSPEGLLTTFTAPDVSGPSEPRVFTPDATVILLPEEKYWFILGSANEGTFDWSYADSDASNTTGPGSLGNFADTQDAGSSWNHGGTFAPYFTQVNVDGNDVLVSNLSEPFRAKTPIGNPGFAYWGAQSFLTGGGNYQLSSIEVITGNGCNSPNIVAELRKSDINGEIDTSTEGLLTTFTAPDVSGPTEPRVFTPDGTVSLIAGEKYWFILGSANEGTFDWSYADSSSTTGPGSLSNYADSGNAGTSWDLRDDAFPYFIQINVDGAGLPVEVVPDSLTVYRGIQIGGTLEDVFESDDSRIRFNPGFTINSAEAPVWLIFNGTLPTDSPDSLKIFLESQAGTPGLTHTLEAWNWTSLAYDVVDVSEASFNIDSIVVADLSSAISDYAQPAVGSVRTRVGWRKTGFTLNYPWEVRVDQMVWAIQQN